MPIQVTCSTCGVSLSTPDSSAGKTGKCPKCGQPLKIPAAQVEDDVLEAEDALLGGLTEEELSAGEVSQDQRRPCPACGELIVREAVKCRYCNEIFDPDLKKKEQKKLKKRKKVAAYNDDDDLTAGEWIIAILCSGIGCILGIIWMVQGKPKGKKMLMIALAVQGFWFLIRIALEASQQPQ